MEALIDGILAYSRAGRVRDEIERVDIGSARRDESIELLAPPTDVDDQRRAADARRCSPSACRCSRCS